jgi:tripeptide aminopeptidase
MLSHENERRYLGLIDKGYVQSLFLELVQIDSHSLEEGKIAQRCRKLLEEIGCTVVEDDAGKALGGQTGNLIASLPGDETRTPILLAAHMDTVKPGQGVKPRVEDGIVYSDGTTVLGADDKAGVTAILAALKAIVDANIPHGPIQVVFTIAEEIGLLGAKHINQDLLRARVGLSLDSGGDLGTLVVAGPTQVKWEAEVFGKAAHAGVAPEKGISAIKIAAQAVAQMPHGRIDEATTVNIGSFVGEGPTNVVRDKVKLLGEARSRNEIRLKEVLHEIESAFERAATDAGGNFRFENINSYDGFRFDTDALVRKMAEAALRDCGFEPVAVESGGGSDANLFTSYGVPTINIGIGYDDIHSTKEHIRLDDIVGAARVVVSFCQLA